MRALRYPQCCWSDILGNSHDAAVAQSLLQFRNVHHRVSGVGVIGVVEAVALHSVLRGVDGDGNVRQALCSCTRCRPITAQVDPAAPAPGRRGKHTTSYPPLGRLPRQEQSLFPQPEIAGVQDQPPLLRRLAGAAPQRMGEGSTLPVLPADHPPTSPRQRYGHGPVSSVQMLTPCSVSRTIRLRRVAVVSGRSRPVPKPSDIAPPAAAAKTRRP